MGMLIHHTWLEQQKAAKANDKAVEPVAESEQEKTHIEENKPVETESRTVRRGRKAKN